MVQYEGIGPEEGTIVTEEEAFDYALERCLHGTPEDQEELQDGVEMLTNIINGILQNLPQLITMGGELIIQFLNAILPALPMVLEAGAQLLLNIVNGIINNLQVYQIYDTLEVNEYIVIDSRKKTIIKRLANGTEQNIFYKKSAGNSVFAEIPSGDLLVSWSGAFGFDITIFKERSVPKWI